MIAKRDGHIGPRINLTVEAGQKARRDEQLSRVVTLVYASS